MNIEEIREYSLSKQFTSEGFPFGDDTLVIKVFDKMFLLANLEGDLGINLKCDPARVDELREQYPAIIPGYHMNKKHWNIVKIDGSLDKDFIKSLIDHSYDMVVSKLPKNLKDKLKTR